MNGMPLLGKIPGGGFWNKWEVIPELPGNQKKLHDEDVHLREDVD